MKYYFSISVTFVIALFLQSCSTLESYGLNPTREENKKEFRTMWSKNLDPAYSTGNLPIGLQSPLIHEGIVYVGDNNGYFRSFELENGREVWSKSDDSTYHSKPVAYKDQIIYGTVSGRVISRHYLTGEVKYNVDLGASVETQGLIHDGRIFFHLRNHQVFNLDIETGKIIWAYKRSVPYLTTLQRASRPVVFGNKLYVGFADGTLGALSLDEGLLLFEVKLSTGVKFIDLDNPILGVDGKIYAGVMGGVLHILNAENGAIIKRSEIVASRPLLVEGDELLIPTTSGRLIRTDKNLNVINEVKLAKGSFSDFVALKDSYLATTTEGEVVEFEKKTLKVLRHKHLGHAYSAVFGEMSVDKSNFAVLSSRNRLYLFQ